jgi:hypothetical protein
MEQQQLATADDAQRLAKGFEDTLRQLNDYGVELRAMQPSALRASLALEYHHEAKRYLEAVEASELREQARRLHEAHRYATAILQRVRKPADTLITQCSSIRADWEIERRRRIEQERQKREQEATRLAQEQRRAEVAHLRVVGRSAEAESREKAPVVPVAVNVDPDAGKPVGESMVEVWVPKRDDQDEIVFTDLGAYLHWVADNPAMHYLVAHRYAKLKKFLTDNRGLVQPPGLAIEHKFEPRARTEPDNA